MKKFLLLSVFPLLMNAMDPCSPEEKKVVQLAAEKVRKATSKEEIILIVQEGIEKFDGESVPTQEIEKMLRTRIEKRKRK